MSPNSNKYVQTKGRAVTWPTSSRDQPPLYTTSKGMGFHKSNDDEDTHMTPLSLSYKGTIHTRREHGNLQAIPLMLLASSVNTTICNSKFHLLASAPARIYTVWIEPEPLRVKREESGTDLVLSSSRRLTLMWDSTTLTSWNWLARSLAWSSWLLIGLVRCWKPYNEHNTPWKYSQV